MNPLALIITLVVAAAILVVPRRHVLGILVACVVLIPIYNSVSLAGLELPVARILLFTLLARMIMRGESSVDGLIGMDKVLLIWAVWMTFAYFALTPSLGSLVNRFGTIWVDVILAYFLCRNYLADSEDVFAIINTLIGVTVVLAVCGFIEYSTRFNIFTKLGGNLYGTIRDGSLRCQGPFGHPIFLGTFAAMTIPLLWAFGKNRWMGTRKALVLWGACAATAIFSGSSSSVFSLVAAMFGVALWYLRDYMKIIIWSTVGLVVALEIAMEAHFWWLPARLNPMGGSAYHRARLVDLYLIRIDEWWLFGTRSNTEWTGSGMTHDVANHLLRIATDGGLLALIIFLLVIFSALKVITGLLRDGRTSEESKVMLWALGALLFTHFVTFYGISYWGQMRFVLPMHLALVASSTVIIRMLNRGETTEEEMTVPMAGAGFDTMHRPGPVRRIP